MTNKTVLDLKVQRVINSCNTLEQLDMAGAFAFLAAKKIEVDTFRRPLLLSEYRRLIFEKSSVLLRTYYRPWFKGKNSVSRSN